MRVPRKLAATWLAAALLIGGRHAAHARDNAADEARNAERPTALGINGGLASAVGIVGVTLTHALHQSFHVEAGAGLGFSGWQLSLMSHAVFFEGRDHFITGVGVAVAIPNDAADGHPVWLNVDAIGYEHRFPNGLALSAIAGIDYGLGGGSSCNAILCDHPEYTEPVRGVWGPQTRVQLAYWF